MNLIRLEDMDFDQVWKIMEISFPPEERRKREKQRELLEKEEYLLYGVKQGENLLGFLAAWELGDFLFMEHFAISPEARNSGLGHRMLQELQAKGHQKIVLEVELPEKELARRRIRFYERNGFFYNEYPYEQPAMSEDSHAIPLRIMSAGEPLTEEAFYRVREVLYRRIYGCRVEDMAEKSRTCDQNESVEKTDRHL